MVIKYSKNEFFSFKTNEIIPHFFIDINYVNANINDKNVISKIIEYNKKVIIKNIKKYKEKKNKCGVKFIQKTHQLTQEFNCILNKITYLKFHKLIPEIIEIFNKYPVEIIQSELCHCFYDRIIYEYQNLPMFIDIIYIINKKCKNTQMINIFINSIREMCDKKFNEFINNEWDNSEENLIEKKKFAGLIFFMSYLYNINLMDIQPLILILLSTNDVINLEMLCYVMYISGGKLKNNKEIINHLIEQRKHINNSKVYYEIENVLDYKKKKWKGVVQSMNKFVNKQNTRINIEKFIENLDIGIPDIHIVDVNELTDNYLNKKEISIISLSIEQSISFIEILLETILEYPDKDIVDFSKYCSKHFNESIIRSAIYNFYKPLTEDQKNDYGEYESKIELLKIDIPLIDEKIRNFELSLK